MSRFNKVNKLIKKIEILSKRLDREKSIVVHQKVNQFYYLEKTEEFKILLEKLQITERELKKTVTLLEYNYITVFNQWKKDIRWINSQIDNCSKLE